MKTKSLVVLFLLLLGIGIGIGSQDASAARLKKEEYGGRIRMYYDKEEIFEAKRLDASGTQTDGGYYVVAFSIPGTKQVCHLTGLTENNMKEVQEELIARYKDGGDFSITSLDFIDTEKKDTTPSGDSELCWAGAAANMLHYAGWGRMSGHECDDIFDLFSEFFYNEGGFIPNAFGWYFNGVSYGTENEMERFREREGAPVDPKAPNGGWYIPDYAFDSATETLTIGGLPGDSKEQCVTIMNRMEKWFEAGDAIGLSVMNEGGGHAIAEFGYVTNEKYPDTDLRHYTAMIVADSDNDKTIIDDRRELPNT